MADLTKYMTPPTVNAIYKWFEESRKDGHRPHLGGSQIGAPCDRALWYQFHWCSSKQFEGRMLRLFDHGDAEETRIVRDLRRIGIDVREVDASTGRQWHFSAFGGHFGLSLDGVGIGFAESSKWHSLEFKTHNDKSFAKLKSDGVEKSKPQHAAQMQIGMELSGIDRAYYIAVNKNTDEIYGERMHHSAKEGERLLRRAERVIFSETALERISERPDWWECKFCDYSEMCHHGGVAEVNCRTCLHSTAERNGTWTCASVTKTVTVEQQRAGCDRHLFRPELIGYAEQVDANDMMVYYKSSAGEFSNGPRSEGCYTSREIATGTMLPLSSDAEAARMFFDGEVVE